MKKSRPSRRRALLACTILVAALSTAQAAQASAGAPAGTPTAVNFAGTPTVGALFVGGLAQPHTCTGSVLDSPHGNLILTAAHCIAGSGAGALFVPGYLRGRAPYGVWTVQRAWTLPGWLASQDPHSDLVLLQVAAHQVGKKLLTLQSITGGIALGQTTLPIDLRTVTARGYPAGLNDAPVSCTAPLNSTWGYPTFTCHGYPSGTSGSPFLWNNPGRPPVLIGVIGGLHQGGCQEWASFSPPLRPTLIPLLSRAILTGPADILPTAGPDGC